MCVEKTRAYVKDNKKKLINGIVGWGRPVYTGEENLPLLSKIGSSDVPAKSTAPKKESTKVVAPVEKKEFKPFKVGSKGEAVKKVQELLNLNADGAFGPGTEKAVKAFQKKSSLPVTGIVDQATLKALTAKPATKRSSGGGGKGMVAL
jgi:peptidoglycan hydrolase-like protein with peptidoglycan-binding domain